MQAAAHYQNALNALQTPAPEWDDELSFAYAAQTLAAYRVWSDKRFGTTEERGPDHFIACMIKSLEHLQHGADDIETFADLGFLFAESLHRSGFSFADLEKAMRERFETYSKAA